MGLDASLRSERRKLIKGVCETHLAFSKEAWNNDLTRFINKRGLLFSNYEVTTSLVMRTLRAARRNNIKTYTEFDDENGRVGWKLNPKGVKL